MIFSNTILKKAVLISILLVPIWMMAQPKVNSPYSRYGFGEIIDNNFSYSQLMGGLGASYASPYAINIVNPATLAHLTTAGFDIGINAKLATLEDKNTKTEGLWSGNLSYFSLAFPLKNTLNDILDRKERELTFGMAFTLKPYSQVGYNIQTTDFNEDIGAVTRAYQGSGGTYDFTWSNAARYKDFSVGLNLGYLFGKATRQRIIDFGDVLTAENSLLEETANYSGFVWRIGGLYSLKLNDAQLKDDKAIPSRRIDIGLHTNSKTNFKTDYASFKGVAQFVGNGSIVRDTFLNEPRDGLKGKLPAEIGVGATFHSGEKFAFGVNYASTFWSGFESEVVNEQLNDVRNLSFGGFFRPNYKSINNYFSRVMYRFGAYYREIPTEVAANEQIDDVGLTFGMSMPFFYQRKISHAHLGLAVGIKGRETLIEERYLKLTFSFTFNDDEWFMKRKYN